MFSPHTKAEHTMILITLKKWQVQASVGHKQELEKWDFAWSKSYIWKVFEISYFTIRHLQILDIPKVSKVARMPCISYLDIQ